MIKLPPNLKMAQTCFQNHSMPPTLNTSTFTHHHMLQHAVTFFLPSATHSNCEGNTETRPLVYRDSLRQGQAEQMWHTDKVVILSSITYTWERDNREHTWHSGNPQRSSWGVPTVSATIQLSEMESESRVRKTEVRDKGWGSKCRQGESRVSSKERQ